MVSLGKRLLISYELGDLNPLTFLLKGKMVFDINFSLRSLCIVLGCISLRTRSMLFSEGMQYCTKVYCMLLSLRGWASSRADVYIWVNFLTSVALKLQCIKRCIYKTKEEKKKENSSGLSLAFLEAFFVVYFLYAQRSVRLRTDSSKSHAP